MLVGHAEALASETPAAAESVLAAGGPNPFEAVAARFVAGVDARTVKVAVLGLGYVGLPLAEAFINAGFPVLGFDPDKSKLDAIAARRSYIRHIADDRLVDMVETGRFEATSDAARLREADALLICVPTPLNAHNEPDLSYVVASAEQIGPHLREGQLVVLESTTYPGTTEEVILPILKRHSGLEPGRDYALAYSPEREDPGNPDFATHSIPKVVGANTPAERDMAVSLYGAFTRAVPVSDLRTAEAVKLTENIFRLVNIGLVNELKSIFAGMDIDVWEVIEGAKTKPFGFMPFYPGPGVGGHCIPIDPFYLTWKAREFGLRSCMIDLAGEITRALPRGVVEAAAEALDMRAGKALSKARVLVVGLAYKKNIDDARESPALEVLDLLLARGASVSYYDPHIPAAAPAVHGQDARIASLTSIDWSEAALRRYDCAIIVTDHDDVDYQALLSSVPLVVDTRNATAPWAGRFGERIVKA